MVLGAASVLAKGCRAKEGPLGAAHRFVVGGRAAAIKNAESANWVSAVRACHANSARMSQL